MEDKEALFKLRWDAQGSALLDSVSSFYQTESFVDTTICTDGKLFKAHRILLSASSPYLNDALLSVPGDHALLLLPHIKAHDFQHVLQFIYEGQVKISQKDLKNFLQISKMLKIKGMDFDDEEAEEFFSSEANHNDSVSSSASATAHATPNPPPPGTGHGHVPLNRQLKRPTSHSPRESLVVSSLNNNNNDIPNPHRKKMTQQNEMGRSNKYRRLDQGGEIEELDEVEEVDEEEDSEFHDGDGLLYTSHLLPEVSMEESEEEHYKDEDGSPPPWGGRGAGTPHSSSGGMRGGYGNNNNNGGGKRLRMMKEPLKSSGIGNNSIGLGNYHHPHELDEVGLNNKRSKRYVSCSACSKVLSSLSALKRHMEDVHCARIQGKCLICGRVYSSRNSLLTHVYSAHKKHNDYKAVARIIRESDYETFGTTN